MNKKMLLIGQVLILALILAACGGAAEQPQLSFEDVDFATSPYKHINNGGITDNEEIPYNLDAITGATMTVEGPGMMTSIPLSVREIENNDEGFVRAIYSDSKGEFIYEGLDLYYLLTGMVEGDNGIILTDSAHSVELKDRNRNTISTFEIAEVKAAHEAGRPIILAGGIGTLDEEFIAPFVYDADGDDEHSLGYIEELDNEDGCTKLVYDLEAYGEGQNYQTFTNVAYIYITEESSPGFKHSPLAEDGFGSSKYTDYIIAVGGSALGHQLEFTVEDLESLVSYGDDGQILEGGMGYRDFYSLANSTYWYVNQFEGLDLYKFLIYLGMEDAETMGLAAARTTLIQFLAADGRRSSESFSVDTLSYPDAFGFYNKNSADLSDGSYVSTNADLENTGYPVLLAYGVNQYPYTVNKTDPEYLSGLSNSGGPIRVVFGKTQYHHANGSNQVQYLSEIVVGENIHYNTHLYTTNADHAALAANTLQITVNSEDGTLLNEQQLTVGQLEDLIYAPDTEKNIIDAAKIKDTYQVNLDGSYNNDIYEGLNLYYLLMNYLGLPGTNGNITFSNGSEELTISLDQLFAKGYNSDLGRANQSAILAFAKNGSPLVADNLAPGYLAEIALNPYLDSEPALYQVDNSGGPLQLIIPSTSPDAADAISLANITDITIDLIPDAYAHLSAPYSDLAASEVHFFGEGLEAEKTYTVAELQAKQVLAKTLDFPLMGGDGNSLEYRYRGLGIYDLFMEIGIKNNAGDVIITTADGQSSTYSLSALKKSDYSNYLAPHKADLYPILAYGIGDINADSMQGLPLVDSNTHPGYDAAMANDNGPIMLIMPEGGEADYDGLANVVSIEVTANDVDTWSHRMSDVYEEFLDYQFTLSIVSSEQEWEFIFTVDELEQMEELIVRDDYSVLDLGECEGVDIWKLIQKYAGDIEGIDDPISITAYAEDGYKNDLLSVFYKEGFVEGVADDNGAKKKLIIAYAMRGYPLVDAESHEGYTGLAGNSSGPLRIVAETNQGASVKQVNKIVVTIP